LQVTNREDGVKKWATALRKKAAAVMSEDAWTCSEAEDAAKTAFES
jgi:hypothetical protein